MSGRGECEQGEHGGGANSVGHGFPPVFLHLTEARSLSSTSRHAATCAAGRPSHRGLSRPIPGTYRYFPDRVPRLSARAHGHHRSAQARQTVPPDLRHFMTPADAPNASDGPLAATKPPEDLAAQPIGNASRTRRVPAPEQRQPGAHSIMAVRPTEPRAPPRSRAPAHHHRRHSIPIAGTTVPRFSPIRF